MPVIDIQKLKEGLHGYFSTQPLEDALAILKAGFKIGALFAVIREVVVVAEKLVADMGDMSGGGSEKKEAVVQFIDDITNTGILDPFDKPFISIGIDAIVAWNNSIFGHKWAAKISSSATIPPTIS